LFSSENQLLALRVALNANNIYPRRYFYPSLNLLPYVNRVEMIVAEDVSNRVLCLPLHADLEIEDVVRICQLINSIAVDNDMPSQIKQSVVALGMKA
jgi:dTDP-4-amino-4,6-dideoxygalactose transaminase